jgi:hypothetical protein
MAMIVMTMLIVRTIISTFVMFVLRLVFRFVFRLVFMFVFRFVFRLVFRLVFMFVFMFRFRFIGHSMRVVSMLVSRIIVMVDGMVVPTMVLGSSLIITFYMIRVLVFMVPVLHLIRLVV